MLLPTIDEETVLESTETTNNGSRLLSHSTIYGASSDDNTSIFSHSTNSTASNLPGPGRVLGNAYSFAGKRFERTLGDIAHRAGFGPEAVYEKICTLGRENWENDSRKGLIFQKLCFKLLEYTNSIVDSTRYAAIMRWGDLLRNHHAIYAWLFFTEKKRTINQAKDILHIIDASLLTNDSLTKSQVDVLLRTSLLIHCHSVGLKFINLGCGKLHLGGKGFQVMWNVRSQADVCSEEIKEWGVVFLYLLESLPNPTICKISQWYIDLWSSQIVVENMHVSFALQSCLTLHSALKAVDPSHIDRWDTLAFLGKKVHEYFVGRSNSRALQLAQWDEFVLFDGIPVHISTILNDLVRSYNRVFSSGLEIVPDLTCITMLGSTDLISADVKENIRGCLKDLQKVGEGKDTTFTVMILLRSCYRLLRRALSELDDTECFIKLSNATSFTDRTSRWAILQLGDILQSLPEVYMLLITLGSDEIKDYVESLRRSLKVSDNPSSTLEHCPGILVNLRLLLVCHAAGLRLASEGTYLSWRYEMSGFITQTALFNNENFRKARDLFVPYMMDSLTFNPLIFYLKYCIFQVSRARPVWYSLLSCSIVHGALLTEKSIPQENRSAMEELCRTMQNSILDQLRSTVNSSLCRRPIIDSVGHAMRSVYADLTESRQTFEDEAEVYLSQLCNILFEFIVKADHKALKALINNAIMELLNFFGSRNVFGWFLSIRGPDGEESISRLLEASDDSTIIDAKKAQYLRSQFSYPEAHKAGVELLAPRHEKLHLEGNGLTKRVSARSSEPPLTPEQRERWTNAFKILATNLSSGDLHLISVSLFYFANCPLPSEFDPLLDTAIAVDYCETLQAVFSNVLWYDVDGLSDLSRAVFHIHTCLTKRVEFVQESCKGLALDEPPTFYGTPFDIPKVLKVLNDLPKRGKTKNCDNAPELLPTLNY